MTEENFDEREFSQRFEDEFKKERNACEKPNILLLGGTGVGKSSLCNAVFGKNVATVGAGAPVTRGVHRYDHELVRIFDSEGYELGEESQKQYEKNIVSGVLDNTTKDIDEQIHIVWYCISFASHRVLDVDLNLIRDVEKRGIPVAVVFTQADEVTEDESREMIDVIRPVVNGAAIFEYSTEPSVGLTAKPLIQWSHDNLEDALRRAFVASQRADMELKWETSKKIIGGFSASAAGMAASPVPFSDAPMLMGNQAGMLASLGNVWDVEGVGEILSGGVVLGLVSQLGRTLVGNIAKLMPGVGSAVGGAINATIASSLTAAIGFAFSEICRRVLEAELEGKEVKLKEYFNSELFNQLVREFFESIRNQGGYGGTS